MPAVPLTVIKCALPNGERAVQELSVVQGAVSSGTVAYRTPDAGQDQTHHMIASELTADTHNNLLVWLQHALANHSTATPIHDISEIMEAR